MLWLLKIQNWLRREEGQDLTEYVLLLALIAILCVGALTALKDQIVATFNKVVAALQ